MDNSDPTNVGIKYFVALRLHYLQGIKDIVCSTTSVTLTQESIDQVTSAEPDGAAEQTSTDEATMTGTIAVGGETHDATLKINLEGTGWCLADVTVS